jgi:hypothetical protein
MEYVAVVAIFVALLAIGWAIYFRQQEKHQ